MYWKRMIATLNLLHVKAYSKYFTFITLFLQHCKTDSTFSSILQIGTLKHR